MNAITNPSENDALAWPDAKDELSATEYDIYRAMCSRAERLMNDSR